MVAVERNFHAEAEERLGRELSDGEKLIDLEGNDRILEQGKEDLYQAIEKEKRRAIRNFLDHKPFEMRVTGEMREILKRLRRAGQAAAELELERAPEEVRAMALPNSRFHYEWDPKLLDGKGGWGLYDALDPNPTTPIAVFPEGHLQSLIDHMEKVIENAASAVAKTAGTSNPLNWVVDQNANGRYVIWQPHGLVAKTPSGAVRSWANREDAEDWLRRAQAQNTADPVLTHAPTLNPSNPWGWKIDVDGKGQYVIRQANGNLIRLPGVDGVPDGAPRAWAKRDDALRWLNRVRVGEVDNPLFPVGIAPPSPAEVRSAIERGVAPQIHGGATVGDAAQVGTGHPFIPRTSDVIAERARLIAAGVLKGAPPIPAGQALLFDPKMQPLMDALNVHMRGISKRILKEGNAQLEIHQDVGVKLLARQIDKKVPGALDAAGRMVSGPFNAGLGDVFKMKGGLFARWAYSAIMDKRTCHVCAYFDGTVYYSWRAIAEVPGAPLPGGGPNPGCFGENRCRCRPVPYFGDVKIGDVVPGGGEITTVKPTGYDGPGPWPPDIEQRMATQQIRDVQHLGGGVSDTYQGWLEDGTHVKVVPFDGTRRIYDQIPLHSDGKNEQANWVLARDYFNPAGPNKVNIPPHIMREVTVGGRTRMSDVSGMVPGFEGGENPNTSDVDGFALFDAIVGQHDHHRNNASLAEDGNFWLIDNGLSFPDRAPRYYAGHTRPWGAYGYHALTPSMRDQLNALERQHAEIETALTPYLTEGQRRQMWKRVDKMLETNHLVTPDLKPYE